MRKPIPEPGACNHEPNRAYRENQSGLSPLPGPEGRRIRKHTVDSHRIGDVLDLAIAERFISANELVLDLLVNAAGNVNRARLRKAFKTRGHVDAITKEIIFFDDHVPKNDTDPILDPVIPRQRCVASRHVLLNNDGAAYGFQRTVKHRNETVAGRFDESPVVLRDTRLNEIALDALDALVRAFFIELHESAVACDVGSDDRSQTPRRHTARRHTIATDIPGRAVPRIPRGVDIANFLAHGRYSTPPETSPTLTAWFQEKCGRAHARGNSIKSTERIAKSVSCFHSLAD